ncbi:helix-turn-helix domain-containing protein [Streptomyces sp. NPDC058961]|uniref:helix-turn-helix domain-containing protein n=1 Tax=Streptomyces sp. NPDC058961 TaxID=3346680 RepID=UPI0036979136
MSRSHPRPSPAPGPGSLAQGATPLDALATWHAEITRAREHRAGRALWLRSGSTTSFNPSPEPRAPGQSGDLGLDGNTAVKAACPTCMTDHQMMSRPAVPAARAARTGRPGRHHRLPSPAERRRLREQWGLTTRQVAAAFQVTPATVRSWEAGRTSPRGRRGAAYGRFLAGLAPHALPISARPDVPPHEPPARTDARTDKSPPAQTAVAAADQQDSSLAGTANEACGVPDQRSPAPRSRPAATRGARVRVAHVDTARRHSTAPAPGLSWGRFAGAAASLWSLALWVIVTCPPTR